MRFRLLTIVCSVGVAMGVISPAAAQAAAPAAGAPVGSVDVATVRGSSFELRGWTLDPQRPSASSALEVTVTGPAGTTRQRQTANRPRADVNSAFRVSGDHGFILRVWLQPNVTQQVCVSALSSVSTVAAASLGCFTATPTPDSPTGTVDSVRGGWLGGQPSENLANNGLTFRGWAADPDNPGVALALRIDDIAPSGAVASSSRVSGVSRPDVSAVVAGAASDAGFDVTVALTPDPGVHTACVFALNAGRGADSLLGCFKAVVTPNPPFGNIDTISLTTTGTMDVAGWAVDPTTPRAPTSLSVGLKQATGLVEGGSESVAPFSRPDVAAAFPWAGDTHGFDAFMQTYRGGTYTVCVRAGTSDNQNLAIVQCKQVSVPDVLGNIDSVSFSGTQVIITGWTYDPAHPDVALGAYGTTKYDIGGWAGSVTVKSRPDVGVAFGTGDNHGFEYAFNRTGLPVGTSMCFRVATDVRIKGIDCITL